MNNLSLRGVKHLLNRNGFQYMDSFGFHLPHPSNPKSPTDGIEDGIANFFGSENLTCLTNRNLDPRSILCFGTPSLTKNSLNFFAKGVSKPLVRVLDTKNAICFLTETNAPQTDADPDLSGEKKFDLECISSLADQKFDLFSL